jgi:hypothetical protein
MGGARRPARDPAVTRGAHGHRSAGSAVAHVVAGRRTAVARDPAAPPSPRLGAESRLPVSGRSGRVASPARLPPRESGAALANMFRSASHKMWYGTTVLVLIASAQNCFVFFGEFFS